MPWLKLSDSVPLERRHRVLSDSANWLLVCLTAYSNREETDGTVPVADLEMARPGGDPRARTKALAELEAAGAVERDGENLLVLWFVPDQLSAAESAKRREQARERQRRQRMRDTERESQRDVTRDRDRDVTRESPRESRTPDPTRPDPTRSDPSRPEQDSPACAGERERAGARTPKRAAPIPNDWAPTDEHRAFAAKHGLDLDLEVTGFRGHFDGQAVKSPNGRFATWLTNAVKFDRGRKDSNGAGQRGPAPVSTSFDTGDDFPEGF